MRLIALVLAGLIVALPLRATAQDAQTLADIRQELSVLYVEVQKLKTELSTTSAPSVDTGGSSVLDRVAAIEAELQRLTAKTEEIEFRIERVVRDGTNRISDLEFRLVELEGGDTSALGETTTLGGGAAAPAAAASPAPTVPQSELAVGEQSDFEAANTALTGGDFETASNLFAQFAQSYPGSPLAARAELGRGKALKGLGDAREAARAFLASFSADATGPVAPEALVELGTALGVLGQTEQACVTLGEVGARFPQSPVVTAAQTEMASLGCT